MSAFALIMPLSIETVAPSASNPFMCWSIGRTPKLHPPGIETLARLQRESRVPSR